MWYGENTPELEELNKKYRELFGIAPYGHMELEYGPSSYTKYVRDIKKAIEIKQPLTAFVK